MFDAHRVQQPRASRLVRCRAALKPALCRVRGSTTVSITGRRQPTPQSAARGKPSPGTGPPPVRWEFAPCRRCVGAVKHNRKTGYLYSYPVYIFCADLVQSFASLTGSAAASIQCTRRHVEQAACQPQSLCGDGSRRSDHCVTRSWVSAFSTDAANLHCTVVRSPPTTIDWTTQAIYTVWLTNLDKME